MGKHAFLHIERNGEAIHFSTEGFSNFELMGLMFHQLNRMFLQTIKNEQKKEKMKMEQEIRETGFNPENIVNVLKEKPGKRKKSK